MDERLKKQLDFILEADKVKNIMRQTYIFPFPLSDQLLLLSNRFPQYIRRALQSSQVYSDPHNQKQSIAD